MADNSTGPPVLTADDYFYLSTFCGYLAGNAGRQWWDVPTKILMIALGDYYGNLTGDPNPEDVMRLTGWSQDTYVFMDTQLAYPDGLNGTIPGLASLLPYTNHPLNSTWITSVFAVFTALTTIALVLRLWSRLSIAGRLQSFDWVTIVAYFMIVAWGALALNESRAAGPYAFYCDETWDQTIAYERDYHILMFTYPIAVFTIKLSLLLFYHQLSAWHPLRWSVYITAFLCFGNMMAAIFTWVFQCNYPDLWDHGADITLNCPLDQVAITLANGGISIGTDIIIWLIPMPMVFQLQLNTKERLLAMATFGIGLVACVGSVLRLIAVKHYLAFGENDGNDSPQEINAWSIVEMNLALICACVPALRALVLKHVPKIISRASDGSDISGSKGSSNYRGHGKPSLVSEEDGPASTAELTEYPRRSDQEKPNAEVRVWSPITKYQTEQYAQLR